MPGRVRMGADDEFGTRKKTSSASVSAIGSLYIAWAEDGGTYVQSLASQDQTPTSLQFDAGRSSSTPVLAFSPIKPNLLAAANGPKIAIYDVETGRIKYSLKGSGRNVTCISFVPMDSKSVITGSTDGNICVWSLKTASRPTHQLRGVEGACCHAAINPDVPNLLATLHRSRIAIWSLSESRLVTVTDLRDEDIKFLSWIPSKEGPGILTLSQEGCINIMDFSNAMDTVKTSWHTAGRSGSDDDDVLSGKHKQLGDVRVCTFNIGNMVLEACILGHNGLLVLPPHSQVLYFYAYSLESHTLTEIWRLQVEHILKDFVLRRRESGVEVIASFDHQMQTFEIPDPVLDGMGWSTAESSMLRPELQRFKTQQGSKRYKGNMSPRRMASKRWRQKMLHLPDSMEKPQRDTVGISNARSVKVSPEDQSESRREAHVFKSMTSSLELPKERHDEDEHDSPMPFLSPSIPARKFSPGPLTPLDESVQLPPRASFDSIDTHGVHGHDSDSDDETLAEEMQGSNSFLPGGLNVPLPSTCGAVFTAGGQLLTFFPSRPKIAPTQEEWVVGDMDDKADRTSIVTRLFPSFGSLLSNVDEASDLSSDESEIGFSAGPKFSLRPSSFEDRPSWSAKASPVKQKLAGLLGDNRVNVTIRDLETLTPTRRWLAGKYQVIPKDEETGSDLCNANAVWATDHGMRDTGDAWRMLALILENRATAPDVGLDISAMPATLVPQMSRNPSIASSFDVSPGALGCEMPNSSHHPFGGGWAVEQLFEWAELRADVQLLACMSAILARTAEAARQPVRSGRSRSSVRSGSISHQLAELDAAVLDATRVPPRIPVVQTNSDGASGRSPIKIQSSGASSSNHSQPTTPYPDSSRSTPPRTLPSLSRQASKLSTSGSASPEHHRSSFSAAARNYAASIAEKFSSYGSSPPTKKLSVSPSNELSSSLPTNHPGSWSKSVSFASTLDPPGTGRRSLSLAREDDEYDSDKTIDDASLPHTPKSHATTIPFKMKQDGFFDESSLTSRDNLMPPRLAAKGRLWREHYAEQLRSWEMFIEAAEIEDRVHSNVYKSARSRSREQSILPRAAGNRKHATCSICYCIIFAAEQLCPACLHTTHPSCLDEIISTLGDVPFTCPTCACDCSLSTDGIYELAEETTTEGPVTEALSFKKATIVGQSRLRHEMQVSDKA
ncbi:hypothetical protein MYCFIDRAFT_191737 [Lecanosticta acicola]|uniref:RING-type domain-containing protein n=1 Tax=Lecanosticta acicola TaxID=111012 RepID=A0AAI9EFX4_9PEZI|nr:hypothetical protein MYCFIDRAFT_191737 [Lecanosticta acicola]